MSDRLRGLAQLGVAILIVAAIFLAPHTGPRAKANDACEAVNEVKAALVDYIDAQMKRSKKSLPTITYYRNHPVELGKALANIERQREETRAAFAPSSC